MPRPQSLDYRTNHGRLLELFGLHLTRKTQDSDILARYRLAVRICHPDKLPQGTAPMVVAHAQEFFVKLTTAKEELLQRAEWVRRRQIDPQTLEQAFPYQEINDTWCAWFIKHFNIDFAVLATSSVFFWNLGEMEGWWRGEMERPYPISPSTKAAATFLEFICYGKDEGIKLIELLLQIAGLTLAQVLDFKTTWKVRVIVQKTHPTSFRGWTKNWARPESSASSSIYS